VSAMATEPKLSAQIRSTRARAHHDRGEQGSSFSLDVSFEAAPGITVLFGPSGCGKSTTLAAIAGLVRPQSGRIALGDDVWFDAARGIDRPPHLRGVAFVFQSLALFPHMTAAQNVVYGMDRSLSRSEKRRRAETLLARLKVGHLADRRPVTFSGGEAQRVALTRAFAMSPRIALFDEPFSAMDRQLRQDLVLDVRSFVGELGIPLVHVTHQRNEARALSDKVILLEAGRIVRVGSAKDLLPAEVLPDMSSDETPLGDPLGEESTEALDRR
jgi:molybdate transport system ATP-binding protein